MNKKKLYYTLPVRMKLEVISKKAPCWHTFMVAARAYNHIKDQLTIEDRKFIKAALLPLDPDFPDAVDKGIATAEFGEGMKIIMNRKADEPLPNLSNFIDDSWIEANDYRYPDMI